MRTFRTAVAATLVLMLAACASAPPTLIALPAAQTASGEPALSGEATILLRHVSVPGYLDGYPVVTGRRSETLTVAAKVEWAERLSDAAGRVLRDALAQCLGSGRVLIAGDGRIPDADLTVEFVALDPHERHLALDARWSFVAAAGKRIDRSGRTRLEVPLASAEASAVAAATSQALGELAVTLAREAAALYPRARTSP